MNTQFNEQVINYDNLLPTITKDPIEFNGFSLSSLCNSKTGIMITTGNIFDNSNIDLGSYVSSQIDGGGIYNKKYGNKQVSINLFIQGESYDDLVSKIDELKKNTQGVEGDFDILLNGEYRSYKATIQNIAIPEFSKNDDFVDGVQIDFLITNGNWIVKEQVSQIFQNISANFEGIVNNIGTYEVFPVLYFICKSSGNSITDLSIELKNIGELDGFICSISETITNNDIVIFDYVNKTITINGVEKPFFGPMTPMQVGFNVFDISFTGSVNLDCYILYNKVYL